MTEGHFDEQRLNVPAEVIQTISNGPLAQFSTEDRINIGQFSTIKVHS